MKLKKVLSFTVAMLLFVIAPITANAVPGNKPQSVVWNSLVLVLPDSAIENYGQDRIITTMHYNEIQKIKDLAQTIEDEYSSIYFKANVDVKCDYEDLKELSYEGIAWNGVKPENVATQIANNAKYNQYDSIIVVYRDVDRTSSFLTNAWVQDKNEISQNATYSTYALNDADHSMPKLNKENAELELLIPMLDSVYREISKTQPNVVSPYTYVDYNDSAKTKEEIYKYINGGVEGSLSHDFSSFINKRY